MALYEGPAKDQGSGKKSPSSSCVMNGDPNENLDKRTPSSNAVAEVTFQNFDVFGE